MTPGFPSRSVKKKILLLTIGYALLVMLASSAGFCSTLLWDSNTKPFPILLFTSPLPGADDFVLGQSSILDSVIFRANENVTFGPLFTTTAVSWSISDSSSQFGTVFSSGSATLSKTQLGCTPAPPLPTAFCDFDEQFALPSVALGPGTYWLHLAAANGFGMDWYEVGAPLFGDPVHHSFQLYGDVVTPPTPEPGTLLMLLVGAGTMGRRWKSR